MKTNRFQRAVLVAMAQGRMFTSHEGWLSLEAWYALSYEGLIVKLPEGWTATGEGREIAQAEIAKQSAAKMKRSATTRSRNAAMK